MFLQNPKNKGQADRSVKGILSFASAKLEAEILKMGSWMKRKAILE